MFETTVVKRHMDHKQARVLSLPLTIILYGSAITIVAFAMVWSVDLPANPPQQYTSVELGKAPPVPLPPPAAAPPTEQQPEEEPVREERIDEIPEPAYDEQARTDEPTVPDTIPDDIPDAGSLPAARRSPSNSSGGGVDGSVGPGVPGGLGDPDKIHEPGGDVTFPVILRQVQPEYPPIGIRMRKEGSVVISCVVGKDGLPRDLRVVSSTHPMFEEPALEALAQYRFRAGQLNGSPVLTRFNLTVRFSLTR